MIIRISEVNLYAFICMEFYLLSYVNQEYIYCRNRFCYLFFMDFYVREREVYEFLYRIKWPIFKS